MTKRKFGRTTKSKHDEQLPLDKLTVTREMKELYALAFEGLGGLQGLIDWARLNSTNKAMFYSHCAKLLPLSTVSQIEATVTVENEEQTKTALTDMIMNVIEARRVMLLAAMERGETLVEAPPFDPDAPLNIHTIAEQMLGLAIDNTVTTVDGVTTVDAVANPPQPATTKPRPDIVNLSRQPPPVVAPQPVSEPSTTQKYLEWASNGGGNGLMRGKDWGPC